MIGDWEQKSETLWVYRRHGHALIYGYVTRQPGAVLPSGVGDRWDALAASEQGADRAVRIGVSLDEAKRAVEQNVATHGSRAEQQG